MERLADSQDRGNGDRPASFDLLPMAGRETKRNHVFLAVATAPPQLLHAQAEIAEKFIGVWHAFFYSEHEQKHHEQNSWEHATIIREDRARRYLKRKKGDGTNHGHH